MFGFILAEHFHFGVLYLFFSYLNNKILTMSTHGDSDSDDSTSSDELARTRLALQSELARAKKEKLENLKGSSEYSSARKDARLKERTAVESMREELANLKRGRQEIQSEIPKVSRGPPNHPSGERVSRGRQPGNVSDVEGITGSKRSKGEKGRDGDEPVKDGKKPIMDSDGNSYRVLNQQVGGENLIKSRFARRISNRIRHEEYFGEDRTKLDADRVRRVIADKMQVSIFHMPRGSMEDWSNLALYKSIINLPVMSEEGLPLFLEGGCTSLAWFLPKGSQPASTDLALAATALKNMEWVFRVVGSEKGFRNLSASILPVLFAEDVLLANPDYVIHWIEARIRAFNCIVSTVYGNASLAGMGYPVDMNSVASCSQLWDALFSSFEGSVTERNMRIFRDEEAEHRIHRFTMAADFKLRGDYIGVPGAGSPASESAGNKAPAEEETDKPKSRKQRRRERKARKERDTDGQVREGGSDSDAPKGGDAGKVAERPEVKSGPGGVVNAPGSSAQGYCGAHLAFLANVGPACSRPDCRYLHVQTFARAKLLLVRRVLASTWSESQTQEVLDAIDDQALAECMDKDAKQFIPKALRTTRA